MKNQSSSICHTKKYSRDFGLKISYHNRSMWPWLLPAIAAAILLFQSCLKSPTTPDTTSSSWYENVKVEAKNYPDSTIHLFIDALPTFCSWNIYRETGDTNHLLSRYWGQCYYDTCASFNEAIGYKIDFVDDKGVVVQVRHISSTPWTTAIRTGLIIPNDDSKLIKGEPISVIWNPESFPDTVVQIRVYWMTIGLFPTKNGRAKMGWWYPLNDESPTVTVCDSTNTAYNYMQTPKFYHASSSDLITEPALKDSVRIGLATALTWNKNAFTNTVYVYLVDEHKDGGTSIGNCQNTGEFVWSVPNVAPGIYYLRLKEGNNGRIRYSFPFFIYN